MSTKQLLSDRPMMLSVLMTVIIILGLSSAAPDRTIRNIPEYENDLGWELMLAAEKGNLTGVKKLLSMGVDVNFYEGLPLYTASEHGQTEVVRFLLESGANPNGTDDDNLATGQPLKYAAEYNHLEIIDLLVDAGAILEPHEYGATPLELAVENGHIEAVKKLLNAGSDPRRTQSYCLESAAYKGYVDIFKTLLAAGAKVSDRPERIIDAAAGKGNLDIIEAIVETAPELQYLGIGLSRAAQRGHLEVVKYLVGYGVDINTKSALSNAATYGHLDVVKYLLEKGANITCDGESSSCPWHTAAENGHADVIALLVDYGIDINAPLEEDLTRYDGSKYGKGWTAMHFAANDGYPIVKELLDLGADINAQDAKGQTPLQVAVQQEKYIFAKEILKYCANTTLRDNMGKSAMDLAKEIALRNASEVTYMSVVTALKDKFQEKIDLSPNNLRTLLSLTEEFTALVEADAKLNEDIGGIIRYPLFVANCLEYLFEQRARNNMQGLLRVRHC